MATKKQNRGARGSYGNSRQRGYAEAVPAKKKSGAVIAGIIFLLIAIAAIAFLILEFCTAYKPSNGFKKSSSTEQEETLPNNGGSEETAHTASCYVAGITTTTENERTDLNPDILFTFCLNSNDIVVCADYAIKGKVTDVCFTTRLTPGEYTLSRYVECTIEESNIKELFALKGYALNEKYYSAYVKTGNIFTDQDIKLEISVLDSDLIFKFYVGENKTITIEPNNQAYDDNFPIETKYSEPLIFTGEELELTSPLPPDPVKEGYTFTGWYLDEECTIPFTGTITDDTVLYAGWKINTYTLTLNGNGGEPSETTVSGDYDTVPTIPEPTRTGYTFTGWKTEDGKDYDVSSPLIQDLTLTAQWKINTYTLTLNGNGGEPSKTTVSGDYDTVPTIPEPTRTGYTFTGWKTEDGKDYDVSSTLAAQDLTLTAQWQINTYTLTLNGNGGELSETSVSGEYNTVPEIPTPTRTGYDFKGWKTESGKNYDTASPLTQDLTIAAQWEIKVFTVTFIVDGIVYQTMSVEYGTKLVHVMKSAEPALFALYGVDEAGESLASDYAIDGDITVYAEKGTTAQKIKGNWKKITVGVVCGAALLISVSYFIASYTAKRRKNR